MSGQIEYLQLLYSLCNRIMTLAACGAFVQRNSHPFSGCRKRGELEFHIMKLHWKSVSMAVWISLLCVPVAFMRDCEKLALSCVGGIQIAA